MGIYKQKYWQIHPGKNLFLCGGRCISASNISVLALSFWLIVITTGLFFAFDCRLMVKYSVLIPLVTAILFVSVLSTLLKTAFSDPGIIPRATIVEAEWTEAEIAKSISASQIDPNRPYIRLKEVFINGQLVKLKYCTTCKIFRPPRSSHCSVCDNCVERFDHHCPWVGNCIGKRNYRYFFFFNFFLTIYCIFILTVSISNIALLSVANNSLIEALKISPTSVVVIVVAFFSMLSVIGLSGFHCNLICNEISTNEDIKGSYNKLNVKNPYNRGNGCNNCAWVICGPRQPSLLMSTKDIDLSNLPIGCSYRGSDGCMIGPVGVTKTIRNFIEDNPTAVTVPPVVGPPELQHVNYPRQTYKLYNGDASVKDKEVMLSIQDPSCPQNYGTMYPSELTKKD